MSRRASWIGESGSTSATASQRSVRRPTGRAWRSRRRATSTACALVTPTTTSASSSTFHCARPAADELSPPAAAPPSSVDVSPPTARPWRSATAPAAAPSSSRALMSTAPAHWICCPSTKPILRTAPRQQEVAPTPPFSSTSRRRICRSSVSRRSRPCRPARSSSATVRRPLLLVLADPRAELTHSLLADTGGIVSLDLGDLAHLSSLPAAKVTLTGAISLLETVEFAGRQVVVAGSSSGAAGVWNLSCVLSLISPMQRKAVSLTSAASNRDWDVVGQWQLFASPVRHFAYLDSPAPSSSSTSSTAPTRLKNTIAFISANSPVALVSLFPPAVLFTLPGTKSAVEVLATTKDEILVIYEQGLARTCDIKSRELRRSMDRKTAEGVLQDAAWTTWCVTSPSRPSPAPHSRLGVLTCTCAAGFASTTPRRRPLLVRPLPPRPDPLSAGAHAQSCSACPRSSSSHVPRRDGAQPAVVDLPTRPARAGRHAARLTRRPLEGRARGAGLARRSKKPRRLSRYVWPRLGRRRAPRSTRRRAAGSIHLGRA